MDTSCLFCETGNLFRTVEHIIPESMGNDDLMLTGEVCDECQNYLSKIEGYVLNKTMLGLWRVLLTIKTKKGKLPSVDFRKSPNRKGFFPDFSKRHHNLALQAHPDYTTEMIIPDSTQIHFDDNNTGRFNYVMTPRAIHEIGRFLGKIGIELICLQDRKQAREEQFADLRRYVRRGSLDELWPIFHATRGNIKDLISVEERDGVTGESVTCYKYSLFTIGPYIFFGFVVGTDNWFICLNQKFPHPSVGQALGPDVNAIWYAKCQYSNDKGN